MLGDYVKYWLETVHQNGVLTNIHFVTIPPVATDQAVEVTASSKYTGGGEKEDNKMEVLIIICKQWCWEGPGDGWVEGFALAVETS